MFALSCIILRHYLGLNTAMKMARQVSLSLSPFLKEMHNNNNIHTLPHEGGVGGEVHFVRLYNPFKFMDVCTSDLLNGKDTGGFLRQYIQMN